jgi:hypothetical protein
MLPTGFTCHGIPTIAEARTLGAAAWWARSATADFDLVMKISCNPLIAADGWIDPCG